MNNLRAAILCLFVLTGCQSVETTPLAQPASTALGLFDPTKDLLISNFDSKPDVDDLHAIAALSTVLRSAPFDEIQYVAVAGAYGTQGGEYIEAPVLFELAFGDAWLDAHNHRDATIAALADRVIQTLDAGGEVWVQDAGQSDVSSDTVKQVAARRPDLETKSTYHVIQHSDWNESVTAPDKLQTLKQLADYRRIPDGNAVGNGSPGYVSEDASLWQAILTHPDFGPVWTEAKTIADTRNPDAAYVNPAVAKGGLDFSDTAEVAFILGFNEMLGVEAFIATFFDDSGGAETVQP